MHALELTERLPWQYAAHMGAGHTSSTRNKVFLVEEVIL